MSEAIASQQQGFESNKLTKAILIAMVSALVLGCGYHELVKLQINLVTVFDTYIVQGLLELIGQYFVRALKMIVVPLVFFSLIAGLTAIQADSKENAMDGLGARAGFTFALYLCTTMVAVSLALGLASLIDPGAGVAIDTNNTFVPPEKTPLIDVFAAFVPTNIAAAFASGNMLAVIFVSLLFGYAMNHAGQSGQRIGQWCQDVNQVVTQVIWVIMAFAPIGVFALVFEVFADQGVYFMANLASYFLSVVLGLVFQALVVYSLIVGFLARVSVVIFWKKVWHVMVFAFSTASSAATISINLKNAIEKFGVRSDIASFTIPLGATINMDGTAIMQGVAVVFIAGAFGFDLTMVQFLEVILLATLASVGTAAVPSAGLVTLSVVLLQVNLPAEAIGLIIGVDRLLDMLRTSINVAGDAAITLAVGQREGGLDRAVFNTP